MAYKGFEEKTKYIFIIERLSDNQFIGCIGLDVNKRFNRAELGYWIAEPHWNQGYASEATKEMLRFGFEEVDLNKIFGSHYYNNPASGKVMVHNGMIKEAELKEHIKKDGRYLSVIQYRLTKKEYNKKKDFQ
jgi:RimJ/RimL family protein N-acetyltransferase